MRIRCFTILKINFLIVSSQLVVVVVLVLVVLVLRQEVRVNYYSHFLIYHNNMCSERFLLDESQQFLNTKIEHIKQYNIIILRLVLDLFYYSSMPRR